MFGSSDPAVQASALSDLGLPLLTDAQNFRASASAATPLSNAAPPLFECGPDARLHGVERLKSGQSCIFKGRLPIQVQGCLNRQGVIPDQLKLLPRLLA